MRVRIKLGPLLTFPLWTWLLMLTSGALGHIFGDSAFFLAYWETCVVGLALLLVGAVFRR